MGTSSASVFMAAYESVQFKPFSGADRPLIYASADTVSALEPLCMGFGQYLFDVISG